MAYQARLEIGVDSRGAQSNVDKLDKSLEGVTKSGNAASNSTKKMGNESQKASRKVRAASSSVDRLTRSARNFIGVSLGGLSAALAVRETVRAADTYADLRSQIRLVTDSQEELNRVYASTFQLSQDTRQDFESTVNLYARLARATEELGTSEDDLLTITRAINQSFIVSGASAQEASSAILQLSQGIGSGTLRGEELNSVLENSPRLARAIAEGLGVTIGQLRQLGADGRLTGEAVTTALLRTADTIERDFSTMQRTVGQSLQQLRNDLLDTFGRTDTSGLVDSVDDLREVITDPQFKQGIIELSSALIRLTSSAASATAGTAGFARWLGEEFAAFFHGPAPDDVVRLSDRIINFRAELERLGNVPGGKEDPRYEILKGQIADLEAQYEAATAAQAKFLAPQAELAPITVRAGGSPAASVSGSGKEREKELKAEEEALNRVIDAAAARTDQIREARELDMRYAEERESQLAAVEEGLYSEERSILASYERRKNIILNNTEETSLRRRQLLMQLEQQTGNELAELNKGFWGNYLEAAERTLTSLDGFAESTIGNFASGFGSAVESVVFDAQTGTEALQGLAEGMARSVVSALAEMAAQWVAYKLVQLAVGKTAATASAAAMIANAQAASAMASLNAFASTAAIPIVGPALAPGAAVAATAATAPYVATVAATSFAGAFDSGGRIPAGQFGLVGERGPELISGPAQVTGRQATSRMGGGGVVVNLNEDASRAGQVQQRDANGQQVIDVFVANIRSGGAADAVMRNTYNLQRRGT